MPSKDTEGWLQLWLLMNEESFIMIKQHNIYQLLQQLIDISSAIITDQQIDSYRLIINLMKKGIFLLAFLAFALAMNIIETNSLSRHIDLSVDQKTAFKNLQISNNTGSGISAEMAVYFKKNINDAYTYYRDNITANAQYIQNKLEGSYTGTFQVLIFAENSTASFYGYCIGGYTYVTWTGVNTAKPLWSYVILVLSYSRINTNIIGTYQKGSGISSSLQTIIENVIKKYETGKNCTCYPFGVSADLQNYDSQKWNAVCSFPKRDGGGQGFIGQISQVDEKYLQTLQMTTTGCRYLLWVV